MNRTLMVAPLGMVLLGSCVSVPRDAGLADVNVAVEARTGWRIDVARAVDPSVDDPRVEALLDGEVDADRAVAIALVNSPSVGMALAELGLARADLIDASTVSNPIFSAEIRAPRSPARPFEWTLSQSLLDLVTLPRRKRMGKLEFEEAGLRTTSVILGVAADARAAHAELVAATRKRELTGRIAESSRVAVELAQRQHDAGNIADLELELRQSNYEQSKLDLARVTVEERERHETLSRAMGLRGSMEWSVVDAFAPLPEGEMSDSEIEAAASRRLDLAIARLEAERARIALPVRIAQAIGEIGVDVHLQREPDGLRTWGPGIEVPIPVFGHGRAGRTRGEAEFARAMSRLAEVTVTAGSELRLARERVGAARELTLYLRDVLLPRRERILRLTQLEYNGMGVGIYQLLGARDDYVAAERDSIDAQRDYWLARNDLERALDGIGGMRAMPMGDSMNRSAGMARGGGH